MNVHAIAPLGEIKPNIMSTNAYFCSDDIGLCGFNVSNSYT